MGELAVYVTRRQELRGSGAFRPGGSFKALAWTVQSSQFQLREDWTIALLNMENGLGGSKFLVESFGPALGKPSGVAFPRPTVAAMSSRAVLPKPALASAPLSNQQRLMDGTAKVRRNSQSIPNCANPEDAQEPHKNHTSARGLFPASKQEIQVFNLQAPSSALG
ncbi:uncharacterized protein BJX67DRAFT_965 [Aspergillus lucknowensis]|uniref:Uncharacterized protein n=1 Tax=Aspergillus lucknowensis TaxID=176173 RepID=A0ABR4M6P6_9EURO